MPSIAPRPPPPKSLYILDCALSAPTQPSGRLLRHTLTSSPNPPSAPEELLSNLALPDGICIDRAAGHLYITLMGDSLASRSGSIIRTNLDGSDVRTVIEKGREGVWTPKQITLVDHAGPRNTKESPADRNGKSESESESEKWLYWCDREGMKLARARLDAGLPATPEILLDTSPDDSASDADSKDLRNWCVGVAVNTLTNTIFWSQKGGSKANQGRIFRASLDDVPGTKELLFDALPEPIDLELSRDGEVLYWTDRGDPPRGNTLNCGVVGGKGVQMGKREVRVLASRLHEAIGVAVDEEDGEAFVTDLAGGVYCVGLEGGEKRVLFPELGDLTGVALG